MIYGARVTQARLLLGETQGAFGVALGLRQPRVSSAEKQDAPLPEAAVLAMAEHTGFPLEFFSRPPATNAAVPEYQFRARVRFKAADRHRAVAAAQLVHEAYAYLRREATTVPVAVPALSHLTPSQAAREFRHVLGMAPHSPLPNLMFAAERLGCVILALPVEGNKHDAFSWWHTDGADAYPVVAVLAGAPGDRLRWNVAHELGHIVLHRSAVPDADVEREADQFAAELLTPLDALAGEMPTRPQLSNLYAMKMRWGVSVQSLIRRARDLGAVTDDYYMSLFRQVSARGERMVERYQIRREKPRAFRKMAEVVFGASPAEELALALAWTPEFARDVLDGFATTADLPTVQPAQRGADLAPVVQMRHR